MLISAACHVCGYCRNFRMRNFAATCTTTLPHNLYPPLPQLYQMCTLAQKHCPTIFFIPTILHLHSVQCILTHSDHVHLLTLVFLSHKSALNVNIEQVGLNLFVWFLYFTTCKRLPIKSLYRGNDFDTNLNIIL